MLTHANKIVCKFTPKLRKFQLTHCLCTSWIAFRIEKFIKMCTLNLININNLNKGGIWQVQSRSLLFTLSPYKNILNKKFLSNRNHTRWLRNITCIKCDIDVDKKHKCRMSLGHWVRNECEMSAKRVRNKCKVWNEKHKWGCWWRKECEGAIFLIKVAEQ